MLLPFALVIFLALRGRHMFESLVWGTLFALVLSLGIGTLRPGEIFSAPAERGDRRCDLCPDRMEPHLHYDAGGGSRCPVSREENLYTERQRKDPEIEH